MTIKQYDKVLLKDGRTAHIVEIFRQGVAYLADIDIVYPDGSIDWNTEDIKQDDIKQVVVE